MKLWVLQLSGEKPAIDRKQETLLNPDYSHFVTPGGQRKMSFKPVINIHSNLIVRAEVI